MRKLALVILHSVQSCIENAGGTAAREIPYPPLQVTEAIFRVLSLGGSDQAVVLTNDPEERLVRKLSSALCAELMSPLLSAEPISDSILEKDSLLELVEVELSEVLFVVELESEFRRLVKESYADCAPDVFPELMALNKLRTSCPSALSVELLEEDEEEEVPEVELVCPEADVA